MFDYETDYYIPDVVAERFPKIVLDQKCILFSIVGASIGNVGLFPGEQKAFLGGAICVAKPKKEYCADYLYYYLSSKYGQKQIFRKVKGAGQATVTIEDIREFIIRKSWNSEIINHRADKLSQDNQKKLIEYADLLLLKQEKDKESK